MSCSKIFLALLSLCLCAWRCDSDSDKDSSSPSLWEPSEDIHVLGPTVFPKPSWKTGSTKAKVVLKPYYGTHRPNVDAVMAYAEGYALPYYLSFVESLKSVKFEGDIVFCIAPHSYLKEGVEEYLKAQPNMIIYLADLTCYNEDRVTKGPRSIKGDGQPDIFQMCSIDHAYAVPKTNKKEPQTVLDDDTVVNAHSQENEDREKIEEAEEWTTVEDPREGRVVATLRYELYWMWSQHYNSRQWILILDARDSYFQSNPFLQVPRRTHLETSDHKSKKDGSSTVGGILHFFGEDANSTRLGKSRKNKNWIQRGYGDHVLQALKDKPTICSGATMGEQIGMEMYLRAMVNEKDESPIRMTGADQGFHNYLYYSSKLAAATAIEKIVLWEQGKGAVNNLSALREVPLVDRGIMNTTTHEIYNKDKSLSAVVHQWDRDKALFNHRRQRVFRQLEQQWKIEKQNLHTKPQ